MVLGVGVHSTGGFGGVDNVRQDVRSNVLWVGRFWGADAGSVARRPSQRSSSSGPSPVMGR
jgi:hypothetical protein